MDVAESRPADGEDPVSVALPRRPARLGHGANRSGESNGTRASRTPRICSNRLRFGSMEV